MRQVFVKTTLARHKQKTIKRILSRHASNSNIAISLSEVGRIMIPSIFDLENEKFENQKIFLNVVKSFKNDLVVFIISGQVINAVRSYKGDNARSSGSGSTGTIAR